VATPVLEQASVRERTSGRWRALASAYLKLTKPRIISLLLVTTVPAMFLAARGVPNLGLVLATLVGGTLAAGGANAINQYVDRDIDEIMRRTRRRPLPAHAIAPAAALVFGIALAVLAFIFLVLTVNLPAALLAMSAVLFYALVYTLWLKRRTVQNIVIGGAAGAVPTLVGWAAVTGRVGLPAVGLFLIVFLWTPPHFWALSLRYSEDYRAAGVPMLPVVAGVERTVRGIFVYALVLVAATIAFIPVGHMGPLYGTSAVVLGVWFVRGTVRLRRQPTPAAAMGVFRDSIVYLSLLFLAVALDAALGRLI
jgi:protoheme IX farnesyltransferase